MSTSSALSEDKAREVCDLLKIVANPNRLRLLCRLIEGECSVSTMESELGIRQPTLSQQLGELREAGLVSTRREHKVVFYTLTDPRATELLGALHDIFCNEGGARPVRLRVRPTGKRPPLSAAVFARIGDAA